MNDEQIKQIQKTGSGIARDNAIREARIAGKTVYYYNDSEDYKVRFSPKDRTYFVKLGTRDEFESDISKNNILAETVLMKVYPITKEQYYDGNNLKQLAEEAQANYKIWETQVADKK